MLKLQQVTKTFGSTRALDGLTMTIPKGCVYGLVGPNGAGKSTAIRCALGVYRPDSGEITFDGAPVFENPEAKVRIASIPDDIFYYPSATPEDMRKFYRGIYPNFDDKLFDRLYEAFQLPKNGQLRRFSKGMQKQAAFQLSISARPDMLILDEPVDGLDPVMRRQVWSLILSEVAQLQLVGAIPEDLEVLHETASGRMKTLVCRGSAEEVTAKVQKLNPIYFDVLPLSLEEIFIYELGGADYEVKNIVL